MTEVKQDPMPEVLWYRPAEEASGSPWAVEAGVSSKSAGSLGYHSLEVEVGEYRLVAVRKVKIEAVTTVR